jgi:lysophospholipase L1-like esterase
MTLTAHSTELFVSTCPGALGFVDVLNRRKPRPHHDIKNPRQRQRPLPPPVQYLPMSIRTPRNPPDLDGFPRSETAGQSAQCAEKIKNRRSKRNSPTPANAIHRSGNDLQPFSPLRLLGTAIFTLCAICIANLSNAQTTQPTTFDFEFHPGAAAPGQIQIAPTTLYSTNLGYGFEPGAKLTAAASDITADKPFWFSVALPQGNYKVTLTLGDSQSASDNTVFAELRRLMLQRVTTNPGQFATRSFIVNVRTPAIAGNGSAVGTAVRITPREKTTEIWAWDNRLTLEFNGPHPAVAALRIEPADVPTLFLMGDSTMCDQPLEPYNSWGQSITRFFKSVIAVSNQAESGESCAGALGKGRFAKIWGDMKPGDYLFVQFGHNDMKSTAPNALDTYTDNLRKVVDETRNRGGIPVLITSVSRRTFDASGKITNSFKGYTDACRQVAKEKNVPLIDLQNMGAAFYESMGDAASHEAFATPKENTHHNDYGSYEIAQCVLQGIQQLKLPIAADITDDFKGFDPSHPDKFADFKIPPSPMHTTQTPLGN